MSEVICWLGEGCAFCEGIGPIDDSANHRVGCPYGDLVDMHDGLAEKLAASEAEAEQLRADSRRLDWVLEEVALLDPGGGKPFIETRAGIDSAMAESKKEACDE